MYRHNIAWFNYIMYDVCRAQDVINPWTSHCNMMVLSSDNDVGHEGHRFSYGKVLGIYHVNVIYVGISMVDFTPLWVEFLWVHWYEPMEQVSSWDTSTLDRLRFPPMNDESSSIQKISSGVAILYLRLPGARDTMMDWGYRHVQGTRKIGVNTMSISKSGAQFINAQCQAHDFRFVDCDMLMCFHFGFGVGHVYSHYRSMQVKLWEVITDETKDADESETLDEAKGADVFEEDEDEDGTSGELTFEECFSSSNKSLLSQFGQMYNNELEVDYEN